MVAQHIFVRHTSPLLQVQAGVEGPKHPPRPPFCVEAKNDVCNAIPLLTESQSPIPGIQDITNRPQCYVIQSGVRPRGEWQSR